MKSQPREVYGFGPKLTTRKDRASQFARMVLLVALAGVVAGVLWS